MKTMTLAQQFPDISMLIREKQKSKPKHDSGVFNDIQFSPNSADQKFYDKQFRNFHFKLLAFIAVLLTGLFLLVLNGQGLWKSLIS